jgi:hypothetical protein
MISREAKPDCDFQLLSFSQDGVSRIRGLTLITVLLAYLSSAVASALSRILGVRECTPVIFAQPDCNFQLLSFSQDGVSRIRGLTLIRVLLVYLSSAVASALSHLLGMRECPSTIYYLYNFVAPVIQGCSKLNAHWPETPCGQSER